jgi:probable rRNA maturation factor
MANTLSLSVRRDGVHPAPSMLSMYRYLHQALHQCHQTAGNSYRLDISLVGVAQMRTLNMRYLGKRKATNILSFEADTPEHSSEIWLGDMVICPEVLRKEAKRYGIPLRMRWAHIMIHGILHLLGYEHTHTPSRKRMETLEKRVMRRLGYPNPYLIRDNSGYV